MIKLDVHKRKNKEKIVITGSSGYIGSILSKHLYKKYDLYLFDIKKPKLRIYGKFYNINLCNKNKLRKLLYKIKPNTIVHLAAQSTIDYVKSKKNSYIRSNIQVTENLVNVSNELCVKKFIFSSSAAIYKASNLKLNENSILKPANLYGKTKLENEKYIISKFKKKNTTYCILRFFNVCSADKKNKMGELHNPETHLIPILINKVYKKKLIKIYGNNYNTQDGTCVRDYIHILDIVRGISKSINFLNKSKSDIFNLGSEKGLSVLEITKACKKKINKNINVNFVKRRFGDNDKLICSINKAKSKLKWKPIYSNINKIIHDEKFWYLYLQKKKIIRKFIY